MNNIIQSVSKSVINNINQECKLDNTERAKINFGLEIIIGSVIKLIILFTTYLILGVFIQSFIAMYTFAMVRLTSGGYHCNTAIKCLIVSLVGFSFIGLISDLFILSNLYYYLIALVLLFIVLLRAPVDPFQRPVSHKRKILMKTISAILLFALIILPIKYNIDNSYKNAILLSICFQVFTITTIGYKTYELINRISYKKREEVTGR